MKDLSIETFRGDLEDLERMAHTAWRDEYGLDSYPNLYRPDYLGYLLSGVHDPAMVLAAYRGDKIVGFLANLPRRLALDGVEYKAALSCLMVTRAEFFRKGLASAMIQEGLKRNKELQFDFTLFYLETGHRSSRLFKKLKDSGAPIERVKRMHVIARILDLPAIRASENVKAYEVMAMKLLGAHRTPSGPTDPFIREAVPEDADDILSLLNSHQNKIRLSRVFSREELLRELMHPRIAHTLVYEKDTEVKGVIAYVVVDHVGRTNVPWAWINHVSWDLLSFGERLSFIKGFLMRAHERRCAGVVEFAKHAYPAGALYAARFVPYPRRVDMMAWRFREDITLQNIPDVYEVQI